MTQRVFGQIQVAQQHTGPQLQNTRIFIVLHASCHTGHLRPSLAAVALPKEAAGGGAAALVLVVWGWKVAERCMSTARP